MDEAVRQLELVVTNFEKRIDSLSWKIQKFERVLLSRNDTSNSCRMMTMMSNFAVACSKYDEIIKLVAEQKKEQEAYIDTLQLQVNIVKSKVETLRALMTKGKTIEF